MSELYAINALCEKIEEASNSHRIQRKVQFLHDIRGYLKINNIQGRFVEFGCYRGHTTYAAQKMLGGLCSEYVGVDLFENSDEDKLAPFVDKSYRCSYDKTCHLYEGHGNMKFIKGDLESWDTFDGLGGVSVALVDANVPEVNENIVAWLAWFALRGCVVFIDDYLTNLDEAGLPYLRGKFGTRPTEPLNFYPPFARAFIIGGDPHDQ